MGTRALAGAGIPAEREGGMAHADDDDVVCSEVTATVEDWLRLRGEDPDRATRLLLRASIRAVHRCRGQAADRDDAVQETLLRALADDAGALRRADATTPLLGWLRTCGWNVRREAARARARFTPEVLGEPLDFDEVRSPVRTPVEILGEEDEARQGLDAILRLARRLPKPYGHVLCWRVLHHRRWGDIRSALNAYKPASSRPICGRQARKLIAAAMEMLHQDQAGRDLRQLHRQKYLRSKNPWIGANLPGISSQSPWGPRPSASGTNQGEPCPPMQA